MVVNFVRPGVNLPLELLCVEMNVEEVRILISIINTILWPTLIAEVLMTRAVMMNIRIVFQ